MPTECFHLGIGRGHLGEKPLALALYGSQPFLRLRELVAQIGSGRHRFHDCHPRMLLLALEFGQSIGCLCDFLLCLGQLRLSGGNIGRSRLQYLSIRIPFRLECG